MVIIKVWLWRHAKIVMTVTQTSDFKQVTNINIIKQSYVAFFTFTTEHAFYFTGLYYQIYVNDVIYMIVYFFMRYSNAVFIISIYCSAMKSIRQRYFWRIYRRYSKRSFRLLETRSFFIWESYNIQIILVCLLVQ